MADGNLTRFEFDGTVEHEGGQQFVSGQGYGGDRWKRMHRPGEHGFASYPVQGGQGVLMNQRGNRESAYVFGSEDPRLRPDLPMGGSALYDHLGNIIKLIGDGGAVFDFASRTATFTAGDWTINAPNGVTINGPLTVNGDVTLDGNLSATGSVIDGDGDGGA